MGIAVLILRIICTNVTPEHEINHGLLFHRNMGNLFKRKNEWLNWLSIKKHDHGPTHTQQLQGRWGDIRLRWTCRLKRGPAGRLGTPWAQIGAAAGAAALGTPLEAFCAWICHLSESQLRFLKPVDCLQFTMFINKQCGVLLHSLINRLRGSPEQDLITYLPSAPNPFKFFSIVPFRLKFPWAVPALLWHKRGDANFR